MHNSPIGKNAVFLVGVFFGFLIVGRALLALQTTPGSSISPDKSLSNLSERAPEQPIPFSHKKHAEFGVTCEYCHASSETKGEIDLPATEKCMTCHSSIAKNKPSIQLLARFNKDGRPVPWVQVYSVPALAFWSHKTHLDVNIPCTSCHGDVSQMDEIRKVTNVTAMAGCVACHTAKNAPTGCLVCHDLQSAHLERQIHHIQSLR